MQGIHLSLILVPLIVFSSELSFSHGGRLDSKGGHWNRTAGTYHYHRKPQPQFQQKEFMDLVARVIDGDTIVLKKLGKVRYIGVNTPETKHPLKGVEYYGAEATEFNKKLVSGKQVKIILDVQERDKYGRVLGYVYVGPKFEVFVNAELVKQGYATVSTYPPNVRFVDLFLKLQREAREKERGLWGEPSSAPASE